MASRSVWLFFQGSPLCRTQPLRLRNVLQANLIQNPAGCSGGKKTVENIRLKIHYNTMDFSRQLNRTELWEYYFAIERSRVRLPEREKLDRRRSTKLTVPPSFDALVYHNDRQALSTARFRRSGQLVTADICWNRQPDRDRQTDRLVAILLSSYPCLER